MKNAARDSNTRNNLDRRLPRRSPDEMGDLGKEIYVRDVRHKVEPELIGKYVAIDVDSACWAVGDSTMEARNKLGEERPEAIDVWMEWIGYEAVAGLGGAPRRTNWSKE